MGRWATTGRPRPSSRRITWLTVRYTARGTHTGEYKGFEPTGHQAEWTGISIYQIEAGEIAEVWVEKDRVGLLEQLELVDRPPHAQLGL